MLAAGVDALRAEPEGARVDSSGSRRAGRSRSEGRTGGGPCRSRSVTWEKSRHGPADRGRGCRSPMRRSASDFRAPDSTVGFCREWMIRARQGLAACRGRPAMEESAKEPASGTIIAHPHVHVDRAVERPAGAECSNRNGSALLDGARDWPATWEGRSRYGCCWDWPDGLHEGRVSKLGVRVGLLPGECVVRFDGPSRCDGWRKRSSKGRARRIVSRRRSQVVRQRSAKPPSPVRIRAAPCF